MLATSEYENRILRGDCLEVLRSLPDASIDSVVTDPPYGLGTREPTAEDIIRYISGESIDTGGDFMGYDWEIPPVAVWRECLRVLKPGGYVLSFAGTRTFDIMSIGIRAAGFENRDTIASMFGASVLSWVHSQGFPKSLNVAKAIRKLPDLDPEKAEALAKIWEGFGTALKPAWEPILCFREPTDLTVVEQVTQTGTGAINIDGTRVKHANEKDLENHKAMVAALKAKGGKLGNSWKNSSDLSGANEVKEAGRWPANALLVHAAGCKQVGTKRVDAPVINRFNDGMKPFGGGAGHEYTSTRTGDADGKEEVAVFECMPHCPVRLLNEASQVGPTPDDATGASRFFAQFVPEAPFFYSAKASRKERNEMLEKSKAPRPKDRVKVVYFRIKEDVDADIFMQIQEVINDQTEKDATDKGLPVEQVTALDVETFAFERLLFEHLVPESLREHFEVDDTVGGNDHPSVKPLALMRYLVRLVTPKGGLVLDPYVGSGTTCLAATEEGMRFVGIEKDPHFYDIAYNRVMRRHEQMEAKRGSEDLFNLIDSLPQE